MLHLLDNSSSSLRPTLSSLKKYGFLTTFLIRLSGKQNLVVATDIFTPIRHGYLQLFTYIAISKNKFVISQYRHQLVTMSLYFGWCTKNSCFILLYCVLCIVCLWKPLNQACLFHFGLSRSDIRLPNIKLVIMYVYNCLIFACIKIRWTNHSTWAFFVLYWNSDGNRRAHQYRHSYNSQISLSWSKTYIAILSWGNIISCQTPASKDITSFLCLGRVEFKWNFVKQVQHWEWHNIWMKVRLLGEAKNSDCLL